MTKIKISLLTFALMLTSVVQMFAQVTTVLPGNFSTSGNGRAPQGSRGFINSCYIITAGELSSTGFSGNQIDGIGWQWNAPPPALAPNGQNIATTGTLRVYVQNTTDAVYNKGTNFTTALSGMTKIIDGTINIPAGTAQIDINVLAGGPGTSVISNIAGQGLYIAFEYATTSTLATPIGAPTVHCTNAGGTVGTAQSNVSYPTTMALSGFRPHTRLLRPPLNDLGVANIYGLGSMAIGYNTNYQIRARVVNNGDFAFAPGQTVQLDVTGANAFTTTALTTTTINPGGQEVVTFSGFTPSVIGNNTVTVSLPLVVDGNAGNNTSNYLMNTTKDIHSFRYVAPVTGGVGFTGFTGDFVAKFTASNNFGNSDTINGFEVIFITGGQPYTVGVWDDDGVGGVPLTNIYTSPSQTSIADTVFISLPDIEVSGSYYVGIRQTGIVNINFGFQTENLVRTGEFYFTSPTGGTAWTDFNTGPSNFRLTATVQYKTPVPPNCAIYQTPANAGFACQNGATLTWASGGGGPTGYRVYFGTNQALVQAEDIGTLVQNGPATTYNTGTLLPATTYHWRVTAYNLIGDASGCVTLSRSFTTNLASCYCASTATTTDEHIGNVATSLPFSNITGGTLYANHTGLGPIFNANIGSTFNIDVTINNVYAEDMIFVFADFNQDGDWTDIGELAGTFDPLVGNGTTNATFTVPITVPINALPGNTLLRIKAGDATFGTPISNDPCQTFSFGEIEDYLLNITCGATATASSPACEGGNLALTSTYFGAGTPVTYSWTTTAPSGYTNGTASPTILGLASGVDNGDYTVTITDNNGCISSATVSVATISPVPVPVVNTPESVCAGLPLGLTANNSAGGQTSTFDWTTTAANAFAATNTQSPSITASASAAQDAGTYTVLITNQFLCTASANIVVTVNNNPVPTIAFQTDVACQGQCTGFTDIDATGGVAPYLFDFLGSATLDGIYSTLCEGANLITVSDDNGCEADITVTLGYISAIPSASVVVPPINNLPPFACSGTLVNNINVPTVVAATQYIWDGPAGTTFNGGNPTPYTSPTPNADITFGSLPGSASGYLIGVQAANGCGASLRKVQWVRGILSTPTVTGPTVLCGGGSGLYSISNPVAMVGAQSYTWTGPAGSTIDGNPTPYTTTSTAAVTLVVPGGFTSGTMCVVANAGCISTPPKCIAISTAPAVLGPLSGNFTVCPPSPAEVYNVSNPGVVGGTYNWILPANTTGSASTLTPSNTLNILAGFTGGDIKVSYTNTCGVTSALRSKTIGIGLPTVPASITTTTTNGLCGQFATFNCPAQAGASFNWTFPTGSTPASITAGPTSVGSTMPGNPFTSGQVCVTATNGCGTSTARCITVKGAPLTPGVITPSPGSWCAATSGVVFNSNISLLTGVYSLNWSVIPGSAVSNPIGQGTNNYTVDWDGSGSATVSITASNACGTTTRTLSVNVSCLRTGDVTPTVPSTDYSLMVNPNPATSLINFEFVASASNTTEINLMDISGRTVMTTVVNATEGFNSGKIDVSQLAKGIYSLQAKSVDGTSVVKVVVE